MQNIVFEFQDLCVMGILVFVTIFSELRQTVKQAFKLASLNSLTENTNYTQFVTN